MCIKSEVDECTTLVRERGTTTRSEAGACSTGASKRLISGYQPVTQLVGCILGSPRVDEL